jgi:hypothetical protein
MRYTAFVVVGLMIFWWKEREKKREQELGWG